MKSLFDQVFESASVNAAVEYLSSPVDEIVQSTDSAIAIRALMRIAVSMSKADPDFLKNTLSQEILSAGDS